MTVKLLASGFAGYLVAMLPLRAIASPAAAASAQSSSWQYSAIQWGIIFGTVLMASLMVAVTFINALQNLPSQPKHREGDRHE